MTAVAVRPLPAATLVLMRDGDEGLEVLLLKRSERAGFVAGGYVFPGGLVEQADCSAEAGELVNGLSAEQAANRLGLHDAYPPAIAYLVAAVREAYEESGLLVGVRSRQSGDIVSGSGRHATALRGDLLDGRIGFPEALGRLRAGIAGDELAYFAHWITPEAAPRRYDTRFFAARVPSADPPVVDPREMTAAVWTTPAAALRGLDAKSIWMILPTIKTLEQLATFADTASAFAGLATTPVATNLPTSAAGGFAAPPAQHRLVEP